MPPKKHFIYYLLMRSLLIIPVFLFFLSSNLCAQLTGTKLMNDIQYKGKKGKINIVQDDEIIKLIDKHLYEEGNKHGITGYRIRIFSNSGPKARKQGETIMGDFISRYSSVSPYFVFDSPFYRLYVGDFRTRSEAMKFLKSIERIYPDAFIVQSKINYPSL